MIDAELLRELQDRERFFYERLPGAAAAEEWKRIRAKTELGRSTATEPDSASDREEAQKF